jgi:RPA family protein
MATNESVPRIDIKDLKAKGELTAHEEQYKAQYPRSEEGLELSKVFVFGIVSEKQSSEKAVSIILDDFTETIKVLAFDEEKKLKLNQIEKGDEIIVLGRIRQDNGEIFLLAEGVHKIEDANEELLFRAEKLRWKKSLFGSKKENPKDDSGEKVEIESDYV